MIKIVIILVIIFLLLSLILIIKNKSSKNIKESGGEYLLLKSYRKDRKDILPSVSQIDLYSKSLFDLHLEMALKRLRERTEININDTTYKISDSHYPSYISDANIDLLYLFYTNLIKNGIGVCEYNSKSGLCGNNLISSVHSNSFEIKNNSEIKLPNLDSNNIQVYIEFVYSDLNDISEAYESIHNQTFKVLNEIINDTNNHKFYIYRFSVEYDYVCKNYSLFENNEIIIKGLGNSYAGKFKNLIIPLTLEENGCKFDEYLHFELINGKKFDIQIEHSEGLDNHKSDVLGFILRNFNDDSKINLYLEKLGYKMNNGKFDYELKGLSNQKLEKSYIYSLNPVWFNKYLGKPQNSINKPISKTNTNIKLVSSRAPRKVTK